MEERKSAVKYIRILLNMGICILSIALLLWLGPKLLGFFMPFVIGWVIALIANPLVRFLERRLKIVRKHSSAIIVIAVLGLVVAGGYFLIAKLVVEGMRFIQELPDLYISTELEIRQMFEKSSRLLNLLPENIRQALNSFANSLSEYMGTFIQSIGVPTVTAAGNAAKNIPNALIQIIVTILSSYFFIAERDQLSVKVRKMIPEPMNKGIDFIYRYFKTVLGGYFKAQFKIMGVVALILFVGFLILNIKYGILLALLIAVLDFLPFFGTGTALIPWAVIKLFGGDYRFAVGLIIIYLVSQLVRQIIQPKIVGDSMGLNPLVTLLFLYIGFKWRGIAGMILAVPLGLILIKSYEAGAFRPITEGVREIVKDINEFRRAGEKKE